MRSWEILLFAGQAIIGHRLRSVLTALGIAIGVAAVVLLTSMGEGLHQYIFTQFTQLNDVLGFYWLGRNVSKEQDMTTLSFQIVRKGYGYIG